MSSDYCNKEEASASRAGSKPRLTSRVPTEPGASTGFLASLTPGKVASGIIGGGLVLLGLRRGGLTGGILQSLGGLVLSKAAFPVEHLPKFAAQRAGR